MISTDLTAKKLLSFLHCLFIAVKFVSPAIDSEACDLMERENRQPANRGR